MNCVDAACFHREYHIIFLLMRYGAKSETIRARNKEFSEKYKKDQVTLMDSKIEEIMDFFELYLPRIDAFVMLRNAQKKDPTDHHLPGVKHPALLGKLLSKRFEKVMHEYLALPNILKPVPVEAPVVEGEAAATNKAH